jgi:FKBP-type peptidyl-prolyl cis-trans isomerase
MKLHLTTLALLSSLAAVAVADIPPPPPKPAPPAAEAPPVPAEPAPAPGQPLLPPPADQNDGFKTEQARQSYALGQHFVAREKAAATSIGAQLATPDDMIQGLTDVLKAAKSKEYAAGVSFGMQILQSGVDVDLEAMTAAIRSAMAGEASKLSPQQQQAAMQRLQNDLIAKRDAKVKAEKDKTLAVANEFMAANGKQDGVLTTPTGVQYKVAQQGEGKLPGPSDMLMISYTARLTDGSVFEKTAEPGPARKPIKMLPPGLREALQLFKTGTKATVWVPPAQGFGEAGRLSPQVKGNQVLIYEVHLVSAEPTPSPKVVPGVPQPGNGRPITATTPPITVEIPPKEGMKPETPKVEAPKSVPDNPPAATPPVEIPAPGTQPAPTPAPPK